MLKRIIVAMGIGVLFVAGATAAGATDVPSEQDKTNGVTYWEDLYGPGVTCYKDDATLGYVDGYDVILNDAGWTVLIVKGGSVDYGDGPGNMVYEEPGANTTGYIPPDNGGDQQAGVSHWIVCGPTPTDDEDDDSDEPDEPGTVDICVDYAMVTIPEDEFTEGDVLYVAEECVAPEVDDSDVTICHYSVDDDTWTELTIAESALVGHAEHEGDIYPVPDEGCPITLDDTEAAGPVETAVSAEAVEAVASYAG